MKSLRWLAVYGQFWRVEMARRWYVYAPLGIVWGLALQRLWLDPIPLSPLLVNWTASLPYRLLWRQPLSGPLQRGDLIVFAYRGPAEHWSVGWRDQPLVKRVRGLPGDHIGVQAREVFINGESVGAAKTTTWDQRPLTPISPGVIPDDHYYVQGQHSAAFDSRYQEVGLVRLEQVLGRVRPLW